MVILEEHSSSWKPFSLTSDLERLKLQSLWYQVTSEEALYTKGLAVRRAFGVIWFIEPESFLLLFFLVALKETLTVIMYASFVGSFCFGFHLNTPTVYGSKFCGRSRRQVFCTADFSERSWTLGSIDIEPPNLLDSSSFEIIYKIYIRPMCCLAQWKFILHLVHCEV